MVFAEYDLLSRGSMLFNDALKIVNMIGHYELSTVFNLMNVTILIE